MERRAEINRFAIFLFCLLVPLGSLAPTDMSERKVTTAEWQKHFTDDIQTMSAVIKNEAHDLFAFYKNCVSATFSPEPSKIRSKARDMAEIIPKCPAFHANCCALHNIYNILKTLEIHIETICNKSSINVVTANLNQLNITLSQGTNYYTCKDQVQDPPQALADRKTYIWWVLERYEDIMQTAKDLYSKPAV